MSDLEVRLEDGALWLTLNRPEQFNALTGEMVLSMIEELRAAAPSEFDEADLADAPSVPVERLEADLLQRRLAGGLTDGCKILRPQTGDVVHGGVFHAVAAPGNGREAYHKAPGMQVRPRRVSAAGSAGWRC